MATDSFFAMLQRRRVVLVVTFVVALVILSFLLLKIKPTYIATSHVMMVGNGSNGSMMPATDMSMLTMSETVIERVARRFSLGHDLSSVLGRVDAKVSPKSVVMPVAFRDKDRKLALAVTN